MSMVGRMFFMPQLLYMLHNTPMAVTLRIFRIINSMFRSFLWLDKPPRIKLEQLQKTKENGGLTLPNPWLCYIAAQLQNIAKVIPKESSGEGNRGDPMMALLTQITGRQNVATGLQALAFTKSNKLFPTYVLMQKIWNKVRQLQGVNGFTGYNPIWDNRYYKKLQSLPRAARWRSFGVTHLVYIIANGKMSPFPELQTKFGLPQSMYFSYLQLHHVVRILAGGELWIRSMAPVLHYMVKVFHFKGFISSSYSMLMFIHQGNFPTKIVTQWEGDVSTFGKEQWEGVLHTIQQCSLNTAQRLSQLFIVMRVHFTPARLYRMGQREDADCPHCTRNRGYLIHLLWRSPKRHLYWRGVLVTINWAFQFDVPLDPKQCILGILEDHITEENPKQAITRALFQTRKLIFRHWKATEPPTLNEWVTQMGVTLRLEKYIFQLRGHPGKFNLVWSPWLNTPGLAPVDLILDRILN